jgi:glycosyltransferase involved in cell wall biosynthesis
MTGDREIVSGKVSVLVVSYNHAATLGQALDSILAQNTNFLLEIVVADDCSTDGTPEIAAQYQQRDPSIFKLLESSGNLGITRNYQRGFAACDGEYVAVLEGDDYWLGADRLQILTQFLDQHPECVMAFNRILYLDTGVASCRPLQWESQQPFELKTGDELAYSNFIGNFSACVYRNEAICKQGSEIYDMRMYDWLFNLSLSRFGLIGYIPRILSVYRQHSNGTWSGLNIEQKLNETLRLIPAYDAYLNHVYAAQLKAHQHGLRFEIENHRLLKLRQKNPRNPFILGYVLLYKIFRRLKRKVLSFLIR